MTPPIAAAACSARREGAGTPVSHEPPTVGPLAAVEALGEAVACRDAAGVGEALGDASDGGETTAADGRAVADGVPQAAVRTTIATSATARDSERAIAGKVPATRPNGSDRAGPAHPPQVDSVVSRVFWNASFAALIASDAALIASISLSIASSCLLL